MQGDATMAQGAPSAGEAANSPGQLGTGLAGGPSATHVLHPQPKDCCPGIVSVFAQIPHL